MISLEKWWILTPLQKLPKNVRDLGKLIVAKGFKKLPKVQKSPNLVTLNLADINYYGTCIRYKMLKMFWITPF